MDVSLSHLRDTHLSSSLVLEDQGKRDYGPDCELGVWVEFFHFICQNWFARCLLLIFNEHVLYKCTLPVLVWIVFLNLLPHEELGLITPILQVRKPKGYQPVNRGSRIEPDIKKNKQTYIYIYFEFSCFTMLCSFCCTAKWISCMYACIPSCLDFIPV